MKNLWSENNDDKVTQIYSQLITHQLYKPITVTSTIRPLSSTNAMHAYVLYKGPNPVIYTVSQKNWATFLRPITLEILNRSLPNLAQIKASSF